MIGGSEGIQVAVSVDAGETSSRSWSSPGRSLPTSSGSKDPGFARVYRRHGVATVWLGLGGSEGPWMAAGRNAGGTRPTSLWLLHRAAQSSANSEGVGLARDRGWQLACEGCSEVQGDNVHARFIV